MYSVRFTVYVFIYFWLIFIRLFKTVYELIFICIRTPHIYPPQISISLSYKKSILSAINLKTGEDRLGGDEWIDFRMNYIIVFRFGDFDLKIFKNITENKFVEQISGQIHFQLLLVLILLVMMTGQTCTVLFVV